MTAFFVTLIIWASLSFSAKSSFQNKVHLIWMAVKRGLVHSNPELQETQQQNRPFKFTKCLFKDEWLQKYSAQLENVIRKVVREETEKVIVHHLQSIPRSLPSEAELSKLRKFKLQFEGQLPRRFYTGNVIEAEGPSPVKVVLLDALSGHLVKDGPLSSAKIKIVALHGHFKAELLEDWTQKEFSDNIVPARDGKRPLLIGELVIALRNGVGFISGICFTDNSSWERSKRFRLGAKIELKMAKEDEVREAVSSPFEVKDRRGETYQKHITPSLEDDVWRLTGIAKDGKICKRLADHQIFKVKDFLHKYHMDQSVLRNILQVRPKAWDALVQQITLCFSSSPCTNLNAFTPNYVCTEPISRTSVSSLPLHHFSASGPSQDQPAVQMPYSLGMGTSCETDQSMALNGDTVVDTNPLVGDFFEGSFDDGQSLSPGYMASSSLGGPSLFWQDMFNFPTSNWVTISQHIEEGCNDLFLDSNGDSSVQILSSIPNLGASTSEMASSKAGWSKLRAKWRILVKYNDATLKKGKFPCNG